MIGGEGVVLDRPGVAREVNHQMVNGIRGVLVVGLFIGGLTATADTGGAEAQYWCGCSHSNRGHVSRPYPSVSQASREAYRHLREAHGVRDRPNLKRAYAKCIRILT